MVVWIRLVEVWSFIVLRVPLESEQRAQVRGSWMLLASCAFDQKTLSHEDWLCLKSVGTKWLGVALLFFSLNDVFVSAGGFLYGGDGRREQTQGPATNRDRWPADPCLSLLRSREDSNCSLIRACSQDLSRCWMQWPRFCAPFPWY